MCLRGHRPDRGQQARGDGGPPRRGPLDGTLVNALLKHCGRALSGINWRAAPRHRPSHRPGHLRAAGGREKRLRPSGAGGPARRPQHVSVYQACLRTPRPDEGTVDSAHRPPSRRPKKMAVTQRGARPAVTHYRCWSGFRAFPCGIRLERRPTRSGPYGPYRPSGGRRSGLRAEKIRPGPRNQCLHAKTLTFVHPHAPGAPDL